MTAEMPNQVTNVPKGREWTQRTKSSQQWIRDVPRTTRFLGWFSVGLGIAELLAPRAIARITGTRRNCGLIRLYGLREIGAGLGIFTQSDPAPWLWARVAGDVVDMISLIKGARPDQKFATANAIAAVAGVTVLDVACAKSASANASREWQAERAEASVLIARSPEECYRFWRNLQNIPRFASDRLTVREVDEKRAHWTARLPGGLGEVEWDVEADEDIPGERVSWHHAPGSPLQARGSAAFEAAPGGRGTYVRVQIEFDHPGRSVASPLSRAIGKHPEQMLYKSLRRMKQLMEVGEIITTEGQPAGRRSGTTWLDTVAR